MWGYGPDGLDCYSGSQDYWEFYECSCGNGYIHYEKENDIGCKMSFVHKCKNCGNEDYSKSKLIGSGKGTTLLPDEYNKMYNLKH